MEDGVGGKEGRVGINDLIEGSALESASLLFLRGNRF